MPKIPRDCGSRRLLGLLARYGYVLTRQRGSHCRLHSEQFDHSITVPNHEPIKVGMRSSILSEVADVVRVEKEDLIRDL